MNLRALAVAAATCLAATSARAQITFEPETLTQAPAAPAATPDKPAPAPPPPAPPKPAPVVDHWQIPVVDLRLVTRLSIDTAFDYPGENVANWYNFLTASVRTRLGPLRLLVTARLRFVAAEQAPTRSPFWLFNGTKPQAQFEPTLGETSISYTAWGIDFSAGMLDVVWGQNPAFSPADVLTSVDLRDGPLPGPDSRIPVPAVRIRGPLGPLSWDAVWLPVFMPSQLPLLGNDWSPYAAATNPAIPDLSKYLDSSTYGLLSSNLLATKYPAQNFTAPQGGLRISAHPGILTVALSWAEFYDRQPVVHLSNSFRQFVSAIQSTGPDVQLEQLTAAAALQADLQNGVAPLTATYQETRVFAFDAALSTGPVRWTLDAGYSPLRVFPLADLTSTVHPMFSGAAGLEWEGPPIIAAGVYSMLAFDVRPGERLLYLETASSPISQERDVSLSVAYLAVQESLLDDRLDAGLMGVVTFHGDVFVTPSVHWHVRDGHSVGAGANLVAGPPGTIGAEYAHNTEVFVEYVLTL